MTTSTATVDAVEVFDEPVAVDVPARLLTSREVAERLVGKQRDGAALDPLGQVAGVPDAGGALRYREPALDDWLAERATPLPQTSSRRASAVAGRTVAQVSPQQAGGDQDAVDPARSDIQARLW